EPSRPDIALEGKIGLPESRVVQLWSRRSPVRIRSSPPHKSPPGAGFRVSGGLPPNRLVLLQFLLTATSWELKSCLACRDLEPEAFKRNVAGDAPDCWGDRG